MCGLLGAAGSLEYGDKDVIKKMLLFDFFRGEDATGIAVVHRHIENKVDVFKKAVDPITAFQMKPFEETLKCSTASAVIGHNRAATRGNKAAHANAHPFKHKHITGAHNGTLSAGSFYDLKKLLDMPDIEVDSEAIFIAIAEYGIEAVAPILQGAWALTWYDAERDSLNWLRNGTRPFWFAYSADLKKLFWASEWGIIDAAMSIGDGSVWPKTSSLELYADEEGMSFWETKVDVHYEWPLADCVTKGFAKVAAIKKPMAGKEPEPVVSSTVSYYTPQGGGAQDPFGRVAANSNGGTTTTKGTGSEEMTTIGSPTTTSPTTTKKTTTKDTKGGKTTPSKTGYEAATVTLFGNDENPLGDVISKTDFEMLATNGCSWCGKDVEYGDPGVTIFERDQVVLCSDCCNTSEGEQARVLVENINQFI